VRKLLLVLLVTILTASPILTATPAQAAGCLDFTEAGSYSVCDDGQANFRTAFDTWGLQKIGYPISQRYERAGFVAQAFQKAIMQWRPDGNRVALVNIFDDLHNDGFDDTLLGTRQTPKQLPDGWDGEGLSFSEVVAKRQALLDARPALHAAYFAASDPLTFYGLPTSEVEDMGNHYAIRLQRAVLQEWKEDVPWASVGQVTIANGGDIAKELGALPTGAAPVTATAAPAATATAQPAPEPTAVPPTSASVAETPPIGEEFIVGSWGMKLYDMKKTKAVYWFDEVEIAQGIFFIPFVEFRNLSSGTARASRDLDFYLMNSEGLTVKYRPTAHASLGAARQFTAGHVYDRIQPGSLLGVSLPFDVPPATGDVWLRVEQDPSFKMYLGNISQMEEYSG